jgi:SpoVK/Ycf46/Vps4 family AAA+-type ATPase
MELTKGYSSADINSVVKESAMGPVREINPKDLM